VERRRGRRPSVRYEEALLVEPIGGDAHNECNADIPDRKRAGNRRPEAFALVVADIAAAQRELTAGQKEDDAEDVGGKSRKNVPTELLKKIAVTSSTAPRITSAPPVRTPNCTSPAMLPRRGTSERRRRLRSADS